jgi:iron complex outermembrane receptor protein
MKLKLIVSSLVLLGLASHALAQSQPQRITITGSSIKRIATEGALPVTVITRADLDRDGITSAEQVILSLSSNGNGLDNLASNADVVDGAARGNNGATSANLRGQGSNATLILLNGRRVASHGLNGGQVDLNQIPMAAIERIEILKDGASSTYGTDAIGGVINFIMRTDFTGGLVRATVDVTEAGGGDIFSGSVVGGFGDLEADGFNVVATLGVRENKALRGDQRDFVNTFQPNRGLSVDTRGTPFATIFPFAGSLFPNAAAYPAIPGTNPVLRYNGGINVLDLPGQPGCGSIDGQGAYDDLIWDFPQAALACAWDTGRAAVLQQPVKSTTFVARGTYKLGEHYLAAELTGSRTESAKRFSNLQFTPNSGRPLLYPRNADSQASYDRVFDALLGAFPANVTEAQRGTPLSYRWRCIDCGPREIETEADTQRWALTADGPLFGGWDYRAGLMQAKSEATSTLGGGYYYTRSVNDANGNPLSYGVVEALNSGKIDIFRFPGTAQTAAGLAELERASARGVVLYGGEFTVTQTDFSASGPVFKLPAGDAMAALGVDRRTEKYRFNGDARAATARPAILAAPFDDGNALAGAKRDVDALYAELLLPVTKSIETTLAVRRDNYSGFGTTTNPKISGLWKPTDTFLLRGSYSTGFRVPSFNQLFNGFSSATYTGRDLVNPVTCPGRRPDSTIPGCEVIDRAAEIISGGKPDLAPEDAKLSSVGFVFEPINGFSVGLDWWKIKREGTIQILTLQQLLDNYEVFPERFAFENGALVSVDQRWINAGETETSGVEVSMQGRLNAVGAVWTAGLEGTYLLSKKSRVLPTVGWGPSQIGVFSFGGDLGLRWKHTASLGYKRGDWNGSFSQTYRSGYRDQVLPGVESGLVNPPDWKPKVDAYVTYNLGLTWTGIKGFTLTGVVKNLLDEDPPFAVTYDSNTGAGSSWEPRVADPRGRAFAITAEYRF